MNNNDVKKLETVLKRELHFLGNSREKWNLQEIIFASTPKTQKIICQKAGVIFGKNSFKEILAAIKEICGEQRES